MEMRLQNVASNKVGLSRIHTQKSCLIPSGCPQIRAVFTLSFCLVDQPIMVSVGHNNSTPPPRAVHGSCVQCQPTETGASLTRPVNVLL